MIHIYSILTEDELNRVEAFLSIAKPVIRTGDYTIEPNWKNMEFDDEFPLRDEQRKRILLSLQPEDCFKIEQNTNPRYEQAELFFFLKDVTIPIYGEEESVKLYLKLYLKELKTYNMVIVISFHKEGFFE